MSETIQNEMQAWLVRSGRDGERDQYNLVNSVVGGGWTEIPDLSAVTTREQLAGIVAGCYRADDSPRVRNYTAQLWALVRAIREGDLVVLPLKTTSQLAIGRVVGTYEYRAGEAPDRRHTRRVEWLRTDVPRSAVKQDLLYSLGAFMTVCKISRNDALWRIQQLANTGQDPGARHVASKDPNTDDGDILAVTPGEELLDIEQFARDRVRQVIGERFAGHALAGLVAAVLETQGFVAQVSEPGPDGGIDVFAGSGPLGLDSPRLVVQVKSSPNPVDAPTVRQLHGVIATHGADQGLMVAWGGVNKVAQRELATQRFNIRVWDADDLIAAVFDHYHLLPDSIRKELPLKQVWTLIEDTPPA